MKIEATFRVIGQESTVKSEWKFDKDNATSLTEMISELTNLRDQSISQIELLAKSQANTNNSSNKHSNRKKNDDTMSDDDEEVDDDGEGGEEEDDDESLSPQKKKQKK